MLKVFVLIQKIITIKKNIAFKNVNRLNGITEDNILYQIEEMPNFDIFVEGGFHMFDELKFYVDDNNNYKFEYNNTKYQIMDKHLYKNDVLLMDNYFNSITINDLKDILKILENQRMYLEFNKQYKFLLDDLKEIDKSLKIKSLLIKISLILLFIANWIHFHNIIISICVFIAFILLIIMITWLKNI